MIEVDVVTDVDVSVLVVKIVDVVKTVTETEQTPLDVGEVFEELILLLDFEELDDELEGTEEVEDGVAPAVNIIQVQAELTASGEI